MRCPFQEPRNGVMRECDPTCALLIVGDAPRADDDGTMRTSEEHACAVAVIASQYGRFGRIANTDKED